MKKILSSLLVFILLLSLTGCGLKNDGNSAVEGKSNQNAVDEQTDISQKSLRVLSIGNSLSRDGMHYLPQIAAEEGIKDAVIAYLYIGNCSLKTHLENAKSGAAAYTYYENRGDGWTSCESTSMRYALCAEKWDYITLQQASGVSGVEDSYKHLDELVDIVISAAEGSPQLLWHMTWAYSADCRYKGFEKYDYNQTAMYNRIVGCIETKVLTNEHIKGVIPVGTAIQNGRSISPDMEFTRDGRHLSRPAGRYLAGLTWYCFLTNTDAADIEFNPEPDKLNSDTVKAVKLAVRNALENK